MLYLQYAKLTIYFVQSTFNDGGLA